MKSALVLAGHGSHISPETAGLVWQHVDELRALNVADEVTAAFWKEMPSFHSVFDILEAEDITVVPLFTAQGYFTQTVIPAEMGLTGAITQRGGRTIRYSRTLNEHPYLGQVVRQRVEEAVKALDVPADQIAVAIIGHSTRRNPESRKATEAQAEQIRAAGLVAEVQAVFLDDTPSISDIYSLTKSPYLVAVPYFLAQGSHTTIDVPRELGIRPNTIDGNVVNGRVVRYTPPVGIDADLRGAILELAREVGMPPRPPHAGSHWDCFPSRGRNVIREMVSRIRVLILGQLRLTGEEVCHVDDDHPTETINDPAQLRRRIRENPFRPLATSDDLPRGWRVPINHDFRKQHAVVETVYPGASAYLMGTDFPADTADGFEATLARQTGQYKRLTALGYKQREAVVQHVCSRCVRRPVWISANSVEKASILLCPQPCDYWLSAALKTLNGNEVE
jgi:sirohydrochlorin cobaltochelatase